MKKKGLMAIARGHTSSSPYNLVSTKTEEEEEEKKEEEEEEEEGVWQRGMRANRSIQPFTQSRERKKEGLKELALR